MKVKEDSSALDAFADALAEANFAVHEKIKEFSIIKRVGEATLGNPDVTRLYSEIVDVIIDETTAENCSLWLIDKAPKRLTLKSARGQEDERCKIFGDQEEGAPSLKLGEGVAGWVAKEGEPLLIEDVSESDKFIKINSPISKNIRSLLCLPIKGPDEIVGVVNLSHPEVSAFSKESERVLSLITNQAYLAFTNVKLFDEIRAFSETLEETVAKRTSELAYSENRYRSFLEHAGDAIIVVEKKAGVIVEVNNQACKFTKMPKTDLIKSSLESMFAPKSREEFAEALTASNGFLSGLAVRMAGAANQYAEAAVSTIPTGGGPMLHIILRDISARRNLEEKLEQYSASLNELVIERTEELKMAQDELMHAAKMAAVGEIASNVAHEINNPLAIISGYSETLTDQIKEDGSIDVDELVETLSIISAQTDRCQKITNSVLNFARRDEMWLGIADINDVVNMTLPLATHKAKGKGINIELKLDPNLPSAITDPNMVEQIILNLLTNAIDAMDRSGNLIIETRFLDEKVLIIVEDDGPGIPEETQKKIFTPFFTTKPKGKGTGLGLAICAQLVERLHAKLDLESAPGAGARFTLSIPTDISEGELEGNYGE